MHRGSNSKNWRQRKLLNEPTGTTGWAPESRPLLLAGGAEKAVRMSRSGARAGSAGFSACLMGGFTGAIGAALATVFAVVGAGGAMVRGLAQGSGAFSATAFGLAAAASRGFGVLTVAAAAARTTLKRLGLAAGSASLPRKAICVLSVAGAAGLVSACGPLNRLPSSPAIVFGC